MCTYRLGDSVLRISQLGTAFGLSGGRSGATSSSMGVCGSVVLFFRRLCLRRPLLNCSGLMQVRRAFRGNVLIYGRLLLRRPRSWGFVPPLSWENSCRCRGALMWHSLHLRSLLGEQHFSECRNLFGLLAARAVSPMLVLFRRTLAGGQRCPHVALAAPKRSSERAVLLTRM